MGRKLFVFFLALISAFLFLYERTRMIFVDFLEENAGGSSINMYVLGMAFCAFCALTISGRLSTKGVLSKSFTILMVSIFVISSLHTITHPFGSKMMYITIMLPFFLFFFTRISVSWENKNVFVIWSMSIVAILLIYTFFTNYYSNLLNEIGGQSNASYYALYFLPFMLCFKKEVFRLISILLILLTVAFSLKRGGLIAFFFGAIVYFYVKQIAITGKKMPIWGYVVMITASIGFFYFFMYLNDSVLNGAILDRFETTSDTGGGGRMDIYMSYLRYIEYDSPINYFIGHGWNGALRDSGIGRSCHNDFLEVFIDFGILGFISYVSLYISLVKKCKKMVKMKHEYAPAMCVSVVIFFVNSMVSHIVIYTWFIIPFALFWGFMESKNAFDIIKKI